MKRPSVLLADDHPILLEGLKTLLEQEFRIVEAVEDGRKVLKAAVELRPDLIVLDISMPNLNGIEAARILKKAIPGVKIIILTMHADPVFAAEALEAGALGYVLKRSTSNDLIRAMHRALRGHRFISHPIAAGTPSRRGEPDQGWPLLSELTPRQREVLQLVAEGHSLKEIASQLEVSVKTVEFHKYRLSKALGLRTTAELTAFAIRHGLVAP